MQRNPPPSPPDSAHAPWRFIEARKILAEFCERTLVLARHMPEGPILWVEAPGTLVLVSEVMGTLLKFEPNPLQRRLQQHWKQKYGRIIRESQLREQRRSAQPKPPEASQELPSSE